MYFSKMKAENSSARHWNRPRKVHFWCFLTDFTHFTRFLTLVLFFLLCFSVISAKNYNCYLDMQSECPKQYEKRCPKTKNRVWGPFPTVFTHFRALNRFHFRHKAVF